MRLLNVYNLEFAEFVAEVPRYAIASHRWQANEATIQNITSGVAKEFAGVKKVLNFCEVVRQWDSDLQWLWIDTCCVDKSSSAELSETINSMFQWYGKADVCFAYLHDVRPGLKSLADLQRSEWFRRGWTLQELLAPQNVVFLNEDWGTVGHKGPLVSWPTEHNLNEYVQIATGIPAAVLRSYENSRSFSVEQRLMWRRGRITSRLEDQAYCLLGIFDLSMPLIYGEGRRAYSRLKLEIERRQMSQGSVESLRHLFATQSLASDPGTNTAQASAVSPALAQQSYAPQTEVHSLRSKLNDAARQLVEQDHELERYKEELQHARHLLLQRDNEIRHIMQRFRDSKVTWIGNTRVIPYTTFIGLARDRLGENVKQDLPARSQDGEKCSGGHAAEDPMILETRDDRDAKLQCAASGDNIAEEPKRDSAAEEATGTIVHGSKDTSQPSDRGKTSLSTLMSLSQSARERRQPGSKDFETVSMRPGARAITLTTAPLPSRLPHGTVSGTSMLPVPMQNLDIDVPAEYTEHYFRQNRKTKKAVQGWLSQQPDSLPDPLVEVYHDSSSTEGCNQQTGQCELQNGIQVPSDKLISANVVVEPLSPVEGSLSSPSNLTKPVQVAVEAAHESRKTTAGLLTASTLRRHRDAIKSGTRERQKRSSKSKRVKDHDTEAADTPTVTAIRTGPEPQSSRMMNNPKLLEMVEDTIKRMILPELSELQGKGQVHTARKRHGEPKARVREPGRIQDRPANRSITFDQDGYGETLEPQMQMTALSEDGRPVLHFARAMFKFEANIPEELSFAKDDTLAIVRYQDDGWWEASTMTKPGTYGLAPSNYLQKC